MRVHWFQPVIIVSTRSVSATSCLQIELLRRKTTLTRRSIGFQDTVKMKEAEFGRCLESVLQPAIERNEQRYRDVDYDIVSGDGLVGTAASLQSLPPHKSATFLRVLAFVHLM